jgi:hypothetical protein
VLQGEGCVTCYVCERGVGACFICRRVAVCALLQRATISRKGNGILASACALDSGRLSDPEEALLWFEL